MQYTSAICKSLTDNYLFFASFKSQVYGQLIFKPSSQVENRSLAVAGKHPVPPYSEERGPPSGVTV